MSINALESYTLLISKGWLWLTNFNTYDEAIEHIAGLRLQNDACQYKVGGAKGTHIYTSKYLEDMGMVGVYQSGGHASMRQQQPAPTPLKKRMFYTPQAGIKPTNVVKQTVGAA